MAQGGVHPLGRHAVAPCVLWCLRVLETVQDVHQFPKHPQGKDCQQRQWERNEQQYHQSVLSAWKAVSAAH